MPRNNQKTVSLEPIRMPVEMKEELFAVSKAYGYNYPSQFVLTLIHDRLLVEKSKEKYRHKKIFGGLDKQTTV